MKSSVTSLGPSTRKIVARIEKVRMAAEKAATRKHRFADFRYLRSVLRAYIDFDDDDVLSHLMEIAPSVLLTPVRADWNCLRVIIEASCIQSDLKMRSRWTRALEYAVAENIKPIDLSRFLRAHGGVAGTADLAAKTMRSRKRRLTATGSVRPPQSGNRSAANGLAEHRAKSPWVLL
jgi:hypothetical protein